jgi:hypothetical protein
LDKTDRKAEMIVMNVVEDLPRDKTQGKTEAEAGTESVMT